MRKPTFTIFTEHESTFQENQPKDGHYESAGDVLRAALRLALDEGEASGPVTSFDIETFLADKRSSHPPDA